MNDEQADLVDHLLAGYRLTLQEDRRSLFDRAEFAAACGGTLARAHARTGDPVAIDGYIGKGAGFAAGIGRFARLYADQNERDHAQLARAIAAGTVPSLPG